MAFVATGVTFVPAALACVVLSQPARLRPARRPRVAAWLVALLAGRERHGPSPCSRSQARSWRRTPRLQVSVVVTNRGDRAVPSLEIVGELLGQRQETQISGGIVAGGAGPSSSISTPDAPDPACTRWCSCSSTRSRARPMPRGTRRSRAGAPGSPVALGAEAEPAVRLEPKPSLLAVTGRLEVAVGERRTGPRTASACARSRPAACARTATAWRSRFPREGTVIAALPLVRAGAPRGTRHDVVLVAETVDGAARPDERGHAIVEVAADPVAAAALATPDPGAGLLLLGVAVGFEIWIRFRLVTGVRTPCSSHLTRVPTPKYGGGGMEKPKDYYQLLGVPRDASLTTIKRAFRRLARRYRPRHEHVDAAQSAFAELQVALRDAQRRRSAPPLRRPAARPARARRVVPPRAGPRPATCAGPSPRRASPRRSCSMPPRRARGTLLSLDVPVTAVCDSCDGTGGNLFDCERCQGDGKVGRRLPVPVHVPPRTREGTVFEVRTDDPATPSLLLTVHLRRRPVTARRERRVGLPGAAAHVASERTSEHNCGAP